MANWFDKMAEKGLEDARNFMTGVAEEERLKASQEVQKKRIQEKQIRALRNNFRPAGGFLQGSGRGVALGESTGLPSKLGTA